MKKPGKEKHTALANDKIPGLIMRFTSTTLCALLLNSVYTLTDALFLSWGVGENAMGAVSVVFPFVIFQGAISTAVGSGGASVVSRKLGKGENAEAGEATKNAMAVFYITAAAVSVLALIFTKPLLSIMGVTAELYDSAKTYFIIILAGNVFSTGFSSIIRAEGKMLYGALIWIIPITVNIALDALFILVLGWGVAGSAFATVACQFISFCMCVIFFTRFTSQSFRGTHLSRRCALEIVATGAPSIIQMGSLSVMSLLLNNILSDIGGTAGLNAYAYISKIITFMMMPFTAVAQALAPVAGYNYGAGKYMRVKQSVNFCTAISFIYAVFAWAVIKFFPKEILGLFTNSSEIISLGTSALNILSWSFLFMPFPLLMGSAFQAAGKKAWAFVMYSANLVLLIPAALILPHYLGMKGIWLAYLLCNVGAAVLALFKMAKVNRRLSGI